MVKRNKYTRWINGRKYCVAIFETFLHVTVSVRNRYYNSASSETYVKSRKLFCDDVDRFAANVLSAAVQKRENLIEDKQQYDDRIEQALDIVKEEYDG